MADDLDRTERVTLALVGERVESLRELVRAEFKGTQRQLDALTDLPLVVHGLLERMVAYDAKQREIDDKLGDVATLKEKVRQHEEKFDEQERRREFRLGPLVPNLIGVSGIAVAIVTLLVAGHA